jgi:hypothetical protein
MIRSGRRWRGPTTAARPVAARGPRPRDLVLDGCVDADIAERQPRLCSQIRQQPGPRKRRQLDRECGHLARLIDERRPVAARSFRDARGDPDRMVIGQGMSRCVSGGGYRPKVSRADNDQTAQGPKTGTKRVPKQANLTSWNRTQFDEIPANRQIPNTPEATHNPKVAGSNPAPLSRPTRRRARKRPANRLTETSRAAP